MGLALAELKKMSIANGAAMEREQNVESTVM